MNDTDAAEAKAAEQLGGAAAAIGRTADAATAILIRMDRWMGVAETFVALYVKKLTPMLDVMLKNMP